MAEMKVIVRALLLIGAVWLALVDAAHADALASAIERAGVGDAEGFYRLALVYERGNDASRDLAEAAAYYERAAELGHVEAQFALGLLLLGVLPGSPHDEAQAFRRFELAAGQGHARAAYFMALGLETGVGVMVDPARAFDWYRRAAVRGDRESFYAVARMYASGTGVQPDLAKAHAWNQVARALGFEAAGAFTAELEERMSDEELALAHSEAQEMLRKYARVKP